MSDLSHQFSYFYNVPYRSGLSFHLIRPQSSDESLPLIVMVHGGGWRQGTKDGFLPIASDMAARGYACATISYTLSGVAPFPRAIEDVKAAIRFLRMRASDYGVDPDRFAGLGASAGGHLISLAALTNPEARFDTGDHLSVSGELSAVVNFCGPTDLHSIVDHVSADDDDHAGWAYHSFLAGDPEGLADRAFRASPVKYVTPSSPPFLIIHGDKDLIVPVDQATALANELDKNGVVYELNRYEDANHDVMTPHYEKHLEDIELFLGRHI